MKVLFLDVDGVLNSHDWWMQRTRHESGWDPTPAMYADYHLDRGAVARLNQVIERTGAKICVSSTWRLGDETRWEELKWMLNYVGLKADVIGRTPDHARRVPEGMIYSAVRRGLEIQAWLDEHPEVTSFAIVDDDSDMAHLLSKLVKTTMEHGLLDEHVERLVEMLGEE